jgi:hypothetical protein
MVSMPYVIFGVIGFMVYRGFKNAQRPLHGQAPEAAEGPEST